MGGKMKDITGMRFGMLVAIKPVSKDKQGYKWLCKCDCGNESVHYGHHLRSCVRSCGCMHKNAAIARTTHHKSKSRLYPIWSGVKQRCLNPKSYNYAQYGGRGIKVCDEWRDSFEAFYEWAMANGYDENAERGKCTLDRIDVNGNYEPSNCRWADTFQQANNMRTQRLIEYNGKTMSLSAWAREVGIKRTTIAGRLAWGWSVEDALTTAPMR